MNSGVMLKTGALPTLRALWVHGAKRVADSFVCKRPWKLNNSIVGPIQEASFPSFEQRFVKRVGRSFFLWDIFQPVILHRSSLQWRGMEAD